MITQPRNPPAPKSVEVWCVVNRFQKVSSVHFSKPRLTVIEKCYGCTVQPMLLVPRPKRPAKNKNSKRKEKS